MEAHATAHPRDSRRLRPFLAEHGRDLPGVQSCWCLCVSTVPFMREAVFNADVRCTTRKAARAARAKRRGNAVRRVRRGAGRRARGASSATTSEQFTNAGGNTGRFVVLACTIAGVPKGVSNLAENMTPDTPG